MNVSVAAAKLVSNLLRFPTILATIPSSGSFRIIFSNGVSLNGTQFDIDFFVIN